MTIAIQRPRKLQNSAVLFGLAIVLAVVAIALYLDSVKPAGASTVVAPTATVAPAKADSWARLRTVDGGFMPPVEPPGDSWARMQSTQSGYLPPTTNRTTGFESDTRTPQPR